MQTPTMQPRYTNTANSSVSSLSNSSSVYVCYVINAFLPTFCIIFFAMFFSPFNSLIVDCGYYNHHTFRNHFHSSSNIVVGIVKESGRKCVYSCLRTGQMPEDK